MTDFINGINPLNHISLKYINTPEQRYIEKETMDAVLMLLASCVLAPTLDAAVPATQLFSAVRAKVKEGTPIPRAGVEKVVCIGGPNIDRLFKADKLTVEPANNIIVLHLTPYESSRYKKGQTALYEGEINKFLKACQVLSRTGAVTLPVYRTPVIKSHANAFSISANYWVSKKDINNIYVEVPQFVLDIAKQWCPDAIPTISVEEMKVDMVEPASVQVGSVW